MKTTNKLQEEYMYYKASLTTLEEGLDALERDYIVEQGITNDDGSTPKAIYCIDNEEVFNRANKEFSELPETVRLWNTILKYKDYLKAAEDKLIAYGLSLAPTPEREILRKSAETNYTTRCKIIDLVLRLDVSTVI